MTQSQEVGQGHDCNRPTHAVGSNGQQDALLVAGVYVYAVVADAETRYDCQLLGSAQRLGVDLRGEDDQAVVTADLFGAEWGGVFS